MNTVLSPRLLIADPCPDNRWSLTFLAKHHGLEVHAAATPAEALVLTKIVRPDVLLVEVMIPRAEAGYSLIEELRRDDECPEIVVVTGYQTQEHLDQCRRFRVPHILKPYCHQALIPLVWELATKRARCRPAALLQSPSLISDRSILQHAM